MEAILLVIVAFVLGLELTDLGGGRKLEIFILLGIPPFFTVDDEEEEVGDLLIGIIEAGATNVFTVVPFTFVGLAEVVGDEEEIFIELYKLELDDELEFLLLLLLLLDE